MKRFTLVLALALTVGGCAHLAAPPNLTANAVIAFHGTQVIQALDRVRDIAVAAHRVEPPLLDAPTTLQIVTWHEQAIVIVHAAKAGYLTVLASSLNALKADLPPHAKQVLAPYLATVDAIVFEVLK